MCNVHRNTCSVALALIMTVIDKIRIGYPITSGNNILELQKNLEALLKFIFNKTKYIL